MVSNKNWTIILFAVMFAMLLLLGTATMVIDPYFHYHKPLNGLEYPIYSQRYQNDGIVKHFEYDAIITGTSMTENFKTSELNEIFNVNAIKIPFSGGYYNEINENLQRAVAANTNIKMVVRGLDYGLLLAEKDSTPYELDFYPTYLYDENWFNDVSYVFNKSILFNDTYGVIEYTKRGEKTTTFDAYSNWMESKVFGKKALDACYERTEKSNEILHMTKEDYEILYGNLTQNVTKLAEENPQIDFYLFFTPYSIYYWDGLKQSGRIERQLEAEKAAIEIFLEFDNIYLFSFWDNFEMICNLDNYKDVSHYGEEINSQILLWMKDKEHLITKENYQEYFDEIYEFYTTYDYEALFI